MERNIAGQFLLTILITVKNIKVTKWLQYFDHPFNLSYLVKISSYCFLVSLMTKVWNTEQKV